MSILDKFLDVMKMSDEDDEFENEEFFDDEEYIDDKPKRNFFSGKKDDGQEANVEEEYQQSTVQSRPRFQSKASQSKPVQSKMVSAKVTPYKSTFKQTTGMEVRVIRPASADDSRDIAEALCEGRTVLLNLEGQDLEVAQRIIDFTSGALFAIEGNLQKVGNYIFLLTPAGVDVSGDMSNMLGAQFGVPSMSSNF